MLLEQLKSEKGFTNHEKDVARYILENLDRIPEMSAGEVADGVDVVGYTTWGCIDLVKCNDR